MLYSNGKLNDIAYSGWGDLEGGFLWSVNRYASLLLPIEKQQTQFGIQMVMEPFVDNDKVKLQTIEIYCNGLFVLGYVSEKVEKEIIFAEIHPSLSAFGSLKIDFVFNNAISPMELGISRDMRVLAYKLFEFQLI
jgi:hypothetical protein